MSSGVFSKPNSSPVQTRRITTRIENTQHTNNRRSLSGKFRNLFRKSSTSPTRTTSNPEYTQSVVVRQRSISPETIPTSTEAPHLRAPLVSLPFGKKKSKSPSAPKTSTNGKTKTKDSKKSKKTTITPLEISGPIYPQEHQTLIQGQNFIPRTPDLTHGNNPRTNSLSNYETTTKGFRDYMVIDHTKATQQAVTSNADNITPPAHRSNQTRSPSTNNQHLPDTNIEYFYHNETSSSPPISDTEVFLTPKQRRKIDDTPSLTMTQMLAEKTPIRPHTSSSSPSKQRRNINDSQSLTTSQILVDKNPNTHLPTTQSLNSTTYSNQWKGTSSFSLDTNDTRSPTTASSIDVDTPKFNTPFVSLGQTSNIDKSKQTYSQSHMDETYNSLSNMSSLFPPNRSYASTYDSLADSEISHTNNVTSLKPAIINVEKYPGLSAIVHYHLNSDALHTTERPPKVKVPQKTRFDASTTTLNEYDQDRQRPNTIISKSPSPPPSVYPHDGYIRPLTPQIPSAQSEVTAIRVDVDGSRVQSSLTPTRSSYYNSSETPLTYRSSTTVFTKDKHGYGDIGELRTWSIHDKDDLDSNKKPSTSIHIERTFNVHDTVQPKITNEYQYNSRNHGKEINYDEMQEENYVVAYECGLHDQPQYLYDQRQHLNNRFSHNFNSDVNTSYTRSSNTIERDKIYDRTTRSYQSIERRQEPLHGKTPVENSEVSLRHYTLKRSDSYDGLGILISADAKTGLNPRIRDVEPGSPGYRAGLRKDDRIMYVNGISVENLDFSDVLLLVQQGLNNNNLQFSVIHESIDF